MTVWQGIRSQTTPVDPTPGVSEWQANTRMRKQGELQRRYGFLSTAIAQQTGAIYDIISANGLGGNFLTFDLNGSEGGFLFGGGGGGNWPPPPVGPLRRRPKGVAGAPQAPVINGVTFSPATPTSGIDQFITMTIDYTYDGLSGPITFTAPNLSDGVLDDIAVVGIVGNLVTYFLEASDPPGVYGNFFAPVDPQATAGPFTSNSIPVSLTVL